MDYFRTLFKQRNLDKEAELYKEKQGRVLYNLEREDQYATKIEAASKVFFNTMTLVATILLFTGAGLLEAPMWMVGVGGGMFAASFLCYAVGMVIETNRNQSQSDSITRALHNKIKQGVSIGSLDEKGDDLLSPKNVKDTKFGHQKDTFDSLIHARNNIELDDALQKVIRADRRGTIIEQVVKCVYAALYIVAMATISLAAYPDFFISNFTTEEILGISSSCLGLSFVTFAAGSYIESSRNKNQTSGLRRLALSELNLNQERKNEVSLLDARETKNLQESASFLDDTLDVKKDSSWRDKSQGSEIGCECLR